MQIKCVVDLFLLPPEGEEGLDLSAGVCAFVEQTIPIDALEDHERSELWSPIETVPGQQMSFARTESEMTLMRIDQIVEPVTAEGTFPKARWFKPMNGHCDIN